MKVSSPTGRHGAVASAEARARRLEKRAEAVRCAVELVEADDDFVVDWSSRRIRWRPLGKSFDLGNVEHLRRFLGGATYRSYKKCNTGPADDLYFYDVDLEPMEAVPYSLEWRCLAVLRAIRVHDELVAGFGQSFRSLGTAVAAAARWVEPNVATALWEVVRDANLARHNWEAAAQDPQPSTPPTVGACWTAESPPKEGRHDPGPGPSAPADEGVVEDEGEQKDAEAGADTLAQARERAGYAVCAAMDEKLLQSEAGERLVEDLGYEIYMLLETDLDEYPPDWFVAEGKLASALRGLWQLTAAHHPCPTLMDAMDDIWNSHLDHGAAAASSTGPQVR